MMPMALSKEPIVKEEQIGDLEDTINKTSPAFDV